jgi:hypothetical protein
MRHALICLAVLMLSSCIPVEDWGGYWDKGVVYPAMTGIWREIPAHGEKNGEPQLVRIVNKKGTYRIDSLDPKDRRDKDYTPMFAKSLVVGPYTFLMTSTGAVEKSDRNIVRYALNKGQLTEYSLSDDAMASYLRWHHPFARNILVTGCKEKCLLHSVKIKVFDDEVFKILSEIPNTAEFWSVADAWRKVGAGAPVAAEKPRHEKTTETKPAPEEKPKAEEPPAPPLPPPPPPAAPPPVENQPAEKPPVEAPPAEPPSDEPRAPTRNPSDQISL